MVYKKQEKKEKVQNTLTLKPGGEKVSSFKSMNSTANRKLFQKFDKRGIIFYLCYAFAIA